MKQGKTTHSPEQKGRRHENIVIALLAALLVALFFGTLSTYNHDVFAGLYDTNDTAIAKVNVTNEYPNVRAVFVYSNSSTADIDLYPGITTKVYCNATIDDSNGYLDINSTNATLFHFTNISDSVNNESSHYSNSSCRLWGGTGTTMESSCSFDVQYFALNGSWTCNVTARDQTVASSYLVASNISIRNISKLVALNVTEVIDYGVMSVNTNSSADFIANVTNLGNVRIDLNLHGYARNDGDLYAMVCEVGNITIGWQKYNLTTPGLDHPAMTNLSGAIAGFTESTFNLGAAVTSADPADRNTFWKIGIPPGLRGQCNGTVVFNAIDG